MASVPFAHIYSERRPIEKKLGYLLFGGLAIGALLGLGIGAATANAVWGLWLGALVGVFLGWFIGAAVVGRDARE